MYHGTEGYLAATNELMLMNIDYETRRSAPWPEWAMERIEKLAAAHAPARPAAGRPPHRYQERSRAMLDHCPTSCPSW